jgi:hypothetical protein
MHVPTSLKPFHLKDVALKIDFCNRPTQPTRCVIPLADFFDTDWDPDTDTAAGTRLTPITPATTTILWARREINRISYYHART